MEKTEKQEKLAFITSGKKILIERLAEQLKEKCGIKSRIDSGYYGHGIYVDVKDYQRAIAVGSAIAVDNDRYEINWIDFDNIPRPVGYIPVMYGVLPQTQKGNELWGAYNMPGSGCPTDLRDYVNCLRDYCGVCDVALGYNKVDNAFTFFVTAPFISHDLMVKRCKGFNYVNGYTPFIETYYPSSDNSLTIDSKKVEEERTNALKSYFFNSLFHDIIRYPEGANIAPHNDDYPHYMGCYGGDTYLAPNVIEVLPEDKLLVKGEFKLNDTKGNKDYTEKYCVVTDSGDFTSELSFEQSGVTITTTTNVSREVVGTDLDGQNHRDAFFTCLSINGSQGTITCTEHFVKIANGCRLLHYSEEFDSFEIFELPNNWFIENGLTDETTGYPKVFDDTAFDHDDKDLNEVYEILNARKKNLGASKVLKQSESRNPKEIS